MKLDRHSMGTSLWRRVRQCRNSGVIGKSDRDWDRVFEMRSFAETSSFWSWLKCAQQYDTFGMGRSICRLLSKSTIKSIDKISWCDPRCRLRRLPVSSPLLARYDNY